MGVILQEEKNKSNAKMRELWVSIKMCPRVIYKRKKKPSKIKNSKMSIWVPLGFSFRFFSGRESMLLWKHPSWMTNSLYGASVSRQGQSFFLVLKFRNQQKAVHSTVLCLSDISAIGRVRVPQTGTDSSGSKRPRKTSPSSYAWKIKRNFPWMFANLHINGPPKKKHDHFIVPQSSQQQ